jgi:hypothetical protein
MNRDPDDPTRITLPGGTRKHRHPLVIQMESDGSTGFGTKGILYSWNLTSDERLELIDFLTTVPPPP